MNGMSFAEVVGILERQGLKRGTGQFVEEMDRRFVEDQGRYYERSQRMSPFHSANREIMTSSDVT